MHEAHMAVERRIFCMIGAEGVLIHGAKKTLKREGVPIPSGGRYWSTKWYT